MNPYNFRYPKNHNAMLINIVHDSMSIIFTQRYHFLTKLGTLWTDWKGHKCIKSRKIDIIRLFEFIVKKLEEINGCVAKIIHSMNRKKRFFSYMIDQLRYQISPYFKSCKLWLWNVERQNSYYIQIYFPFQVPVIKRASFAITVK